MTLLEVSIIIPSYNHKEYLTERINSVIFQTFQNFEIIILDDYSTDNSRDVIENYRDYPKVKHIIYNDTNSGSPFLQWARGIRLAQGEYIWIAESDDFAEPKFLETCVELLSQNPKIGFTYTDSNIIKGKTKIDEFKFRRQNDPSSKWRHPYLEDGIVELEQHLINNCTVNNVSAVLFRKDAISSCLDDIIKFKYAGDWLSYMIICLKYQIMYIPQCLNNYRSHEGNLTKKSNHLYLGLRERIMARHIILSKLTSDQHFLKKKIKKLNRMELRALTGGFIRFRLGIKIYMKALYLYFQKSIIT